MEVSIVIPTLNEEKCLPKLLESIKNQTFKDYEIIVADSNSKDKTIQVAKQYGAKIINGGLPSVARNNGAKIAKGDFIFFFDADIILPKYFLEKAYYEIQERHLELATCEFRPLSSLLIDEVMHDFFNMFIKIYQYTNDPHAFGFCILVSRRLFKKINGFDESIKFAEDSDFVKRASKLRRLRVLKSTGFYVDIRRFTKEGRFNLILKGLKAELYRKLIGEIRKDGIITYEFSNFENKKRTLSDKFKKIEQKLIKINLNYNKLKENFYNINKTLEIFLR